MPNDLTIRPTLPPAVQPAPLDTKLPAVPPPPVGAALAAVVPQIPSIALDAEKGVVVIDFRNDAGAIINSIPTAQQLAAYAAHPLPVPAQPAPGSGETTTSASDSSAPAPRSARPAPHR
ncbi:MAG: hypothetical protein ACREFP_09725 [Acetobacteraceae bacterium]